MAWRSSMLGWGGVARALHWAMALLLLGQGVLGLYMASLPLTAVTAKFELYQLHKSSGLTLGLLAVLRLLWRAVDRRPAWPERMPAWERRAAVANHALLYGLMFALPVTGLLMSAASPLGIPTVVFGLIPIPHPIGPDAALEAVLKRVHALLALGFASLIVLHVAAALKHHIFDRDEVLRQMIRGG